MDWAWLIGFLGAVAALLYKLVRDDPEVVVLIDRVLSALYLLAFMAWTGAQLALWYAKSAVRREFSVLSEGENGEALRRVATQLNELDPVFTIGIWFALALFLLSTFMAWLAKRRMAGQRHENGRQ